MAKDSREHILEVSFSLFLRKSFKAVTMQEIVEKTGLSKGAFYHYFDSKEQVFEEVVRNFYKDLLSHDFDKFSRESLKAFYCDYLESSRHIIQEFQRMEKGRNIKEHFNYYSLIFDAIARIPSFKKMFAEENQRELDIWGKIIATAKKNGEIKTGIANEKIARMFMHIGDGYGLNMILLNTANVQSEFAYELKSIWDGLYSLLKV